MNQSPGELIEQASRRLQQGDPRSAVRLFTEALGCDSTSVVAYAGRAAAYGEIGDLESALLDLCQAIDLAPDEFRLYFNRAHTYEQMGSTVRAVDDYDRAIELNPDEIPPYFNRALALFDRDPERAIEDLSTVIRLQPSYARAYVERGKLYSNRGEFVLAAQDFNSALRINPGDELVQTMRNQT